MRPATVPVTIPAPKTPTPVQVTQPILAPGGGGRIARRAGCRAARWRSPCGRRNRRCEEQDATGGKPSEVEEREGQGGSETATGGTGTGGSATTTGGRATSTGGRATSTGGSAASTGGSGGSGPPDETGELVEDCDAAEADNNDTRETAMALGTGATLCVGVNDVDWLYVDTPDDGKAHILRVLIAPDPGADVSFEVEAAADDSSIGNDYTDVGADATLWVTLGPGTRTLLSFGRFTRGGRFTFVPRFSAK